MENKCRYLRIHETAEELNVSSSTVRRWLADGMLKGLKVRGIVRVDRESIERLVEAHPYRSIAGKGRPSVLARLGRGWRGKAS